MAHRWFYPGARPCTKMSELAPVVFLHLQNVGVEFFAFETSNACTQMARSTADNSGWRQVGHPVIIPVLVVSAWSCELMWLTPPQRGINNSQKEGYSVVSMTALNVHFARYGIIANSKCELMSDSELKKWWRFSVWLYTVYFRTLDWEYFDCTMDMQRLKTVTINKICHAFYIVWC